MKANIKADRYFKRARKPKSIQMKVQLVYIIFK